MKRFQAVVNWEKVKGSHLVVCCLPALSTAGSWLVYSSASTIDGVQGFGAQKLVNSMNWFAQLFSFILIGICAAVGVEALTKK